MKKSKLIIIISLMLIVLGAILGITGYFMGASFNIIKDENGFHVYDEGGLEKQTGTFSQINNIDINGRIDIIKIIKSDKYEISTTNIKGKNEIKFTEENGHLKVETINENTNSVNVNIGIKKPTNILKIYIPENDNLDTININTKNAQIEVNGLNTKDISIKNTHGYLNMSHIKSVSINTELSNGIITMKNIESESMNIENTYGALKIENVNLENLNTSVKNGNTDIKDTKVNKETSLKNSYGTIDIKDCVFNILKGDVNNGSVKIGNSNSENTNIYNAYGSFIANEFISKGTNINGKNSNINLIGEFSGNTKIKSQYGSIKLTTRIQKNLYNYDVYCNNGIINVNGKGYEKVLRENNNSNNNLSIENDNGNITIDFQ